MSSARALLERAALCTESYVLSEKDRHVAKLMALHIIRRCDGHACDEEARLLIELLDG